MTDLQRAEELLAIRRAQVLKHGGRDKSRIITAANAVSGPHEGELSTGAKLHHIYKQLGKMDAELYRLGVRLEPVK